MEAYNLLRFSTPIRPFCKASVTRSLPSTLRRLTASSRRRADTSNNKAPPPTSRSSSINNQLHASLGALGQQYASRSPPSASRNRSGSSPPSSAASLLGGGNVPALPTEAPSLSQFYAEHPTAHEHHLHVYAHKHNTHLTLTDQKRNSIISISAGNLGFRKAQRGTYDAAYQLTAYLLTRMQQQGLMAQIQYLELVFRGFGQGRDAVTKVLMGVEGNRIRDRICRVVDKTRLKIGGTRSPAPRRLG